MYKVVPEGDEVHVHVLSCSLGLQECSHAARCSTDAPYNPEDAPQLSVSFLVFF